MMCHDEELNDQYRAYSYFEKFKQNPSLNPVITVKRFMKSAAGKVMNNPSMLRTPKVLHLTMRYMRDCILDLDFLEPGTSPYEYSFDQ